MKRQDFRSPPWRMWWGVFWTWEFRVHYSKEIITNGSFYGGEQINRQLHLGFVQFRLQFEEVGNWKAIRELMNGNGK